MEVLHQVGDIIAERYRITSTLGQGGIGITYAAQDLRSGQQVALKALSMQQMGEWKVLELFEREAKVLAQLNHPAIPRYIDYFQVDTPEDQGFYIAQELAQGKSLAELVEIGWRTNEDGVRKIATQVLEILVYLHSLKPPVVHRDIKPRNLIWGKDGKIFLVDFGAVQDTYRSTLARGSTIVGTYGYMAPEQFRGQAVPATDLYGLGTTVLFLLTHRSPADLPQERLKINFRSRIQVSEWFANWLEKMLEPDAEDRFSSTKEALEALQGRMVVAKPRLSVSWKVLAGVGVAATIAVIVLNSYKWTVLSTLGFKASGICQAARSGNIDVVRDYLEHGGDPNAEDDSEQATLICASQSNKKDIVELLIAKGADVNVKDIQDTTPLHLASSKEVAELLITKSANVNAKDKQGKTPLHLGSNKEQVALLIAKGADVNAQDNQGNTPLLQASQIYDQEDLALLLIAKGADVSVKNNQGRTPLHGLMEYQGFDEKHRSKAKKLAALLIAKGADINAKDNQGQTPLHLAAGNFLSTNNIGELLIAKGADVNVKDNQGNTPLHIAVNSLSDLAAMLIAKGADINAKNNQGETSLHLIMQRNDRKDWVAWLIAKGADVNAKNNHGKTPLFLALKGNDKKDLAELLISKGADIKTKDNQGHTPLQVAIFDECSCSKDIVKLLILKGADVNVQSAKGYTPMHLAAGYNWKDIGELLIAKGADVNATEFFGLTPLDIATMNSQMDMVKLLTTHGGISHLCRKVNNRTVCQANR